MSLLEDIFLHDEADEAQELERVIEGDEYDEIPRSRSVTPNSDDNEAKEDEAEEDKRRVDPSSTKAKRVTKNPRFILNPARLTGPRGIQIIPDHFKHFKFKGKGHEKEDLDMVLKKLEHWAYRLYPKFQFEDCLKKIETLGKKRPVMVHLHKIRTDQFMSEETVVQKDSSDEETQQPQEEDEFDKLLQQQIELARATPAPGSVKKVVDTPRVDRSPFTMPKATSSPSISDEQKERMMRNRRLAEERRLARLKQKTINNSPKESPNDFGKIIEVDEEIESVPAKKHNRSNVVDSSDDECNVSSVNQAVTVDVHNATNNGEAKNTSIDKRKGLEGARSSFDDLIQVDQDMEIVDDVGEKVKANKAVGDVIEMNDQDHTMNDKNDQVIEVNDDYTRVVNTNEVVDEVIELNDQGHIINHKNNDKVTEIIEINDQVTKINDQSTEIVTVDERIIEINDQMDTVPENTVSKISDNEIITDNDTTTADTSKNKVLKVESIKEIQNNTTMNDSPNNTDNIEFTVSKEIRKDGDTEQTDFELNKTNKDASNLEQTNNNTVGEFAEDIMDVDFSDDF